MHRLHLVTSVIILMILSAGTLQGKPKTLPNVILIITDDLGWGDLSCYGAQEIQTPHIDRLAAQGQRFTNAYAPSSTCTPTRYAIMTGDYGWRRPPQETGILDGDAPLAIKPHSLTLPALLKKAGYTTGLVGKWHLGLGDGRKEVDFNGTIKPGPLECGFDSAFFIPATVDRVPNVFIRNHRVDKLDPKDPIQISYRGALGDEPMGRDFPERLKVGADNQHADVIVNGISRIGTMTGGWRARWVDEAIADTITAEAVRFIETHKDRPFFLNFGTHDPHVPRMPNPRFVGKSGCGIRGDTVVQIDWCVGEIMAALEKNNLTENTLVLFTSDNGPVLFDGYFDGALEDQNGHQPAGGLEGWKYLVYEGGTRVPLIARWPAGIKPGVSDHLFSLVDLLATCAALCGQPLPDNIGVDSLNLLDTLLGKARRSQRNIVVQHGISDALSLRQGHWKYIPANAKGEATGIGRGANPKDQRFVKAKIFEDKLFDLSQDPAETKNLATQYPKKVKELAALLADLRKQGHRPGGKRLQ